MSGLEKSLDEQDRTGYFKKSDRKQVRILYDDQERTKRTNHGKMSRKNMT